MGTHLQEMDFIFDTGSSWTWIPNKDCSEFDCGRNKRYNYEKSKKYEISKNEKEVHYGVGSITGYIASDSIAITNSTQFQA